MSALSGLRIDNLVVEINGKEIPFLDGSSLEFLKAIKNAGIVEQDAPREWIEIKEPVLTSRNDASIIALAHPSFKVSYLLDYSHLFLLR